MHTGPRGFHLCPRRLDHRFNSPNSGLFFFRFVSLHTFSSTPSLISQFISFNISWINPSMFCRLLINGYKFTTQDGKAPGPFTILLYIIYMSVVSQQLKDIFYFYPYNISTEN